MKKFAKVVFLSLFMLVTGCSNNKNNTTPDNSSNENEATQNQTRDITYSDSDMEYFKEKYGSFSITREDGLSPNYVFNEQENTYVLNVEESKAKYVFKGYTEAGFIIRNDNNLSTFKGLKIKLDSACIVSKNSISPINYSLDSKNVEITAKRQTTNYIISLEGANAIDSTNNIELGGEGTLNLYTKKTLADESDGHTIKSSNKVSIYDSIKLNITSAHDGIHCDEIYTINEDDNINYSGTINFKDIGSQAMEATTKSCGGLINLSGGKYNINNADSVFKSDKSITIASGVEIVSTNIKNQPVVKQTKEEVGTNITIPPLDLVVNGSFTCNGQAVESIKF